MTDNKGNVNNLSITQFPTLLIHPAGTSKDLTNATVSKVSDMTL